MVSKVMFSSKQRVWSTPQIFFDEQNAIHHFTLDVCAIKSNAKCEKFISPKQDSLIQNWGQNICWMNPPYGRTITPKWVKKAWDSAQLGATVVCLLPSRTDTRWFHDYVIKGEVTFVKGRLKFGESTDGAPFPSVLVVFRPPGAKKRRIVKVC